MIRLLGRLGLVAAVIHTGVEMLLELKRGLELLVAGHAYRMLQLVMHAETKLILDPCVTEGTADVLLVHMLSKIFFESECAMTTKSTSEAVELALMLVNGGIID